MGTSIVRSVSSEEIAELQARIAQASQMNSGVAPGKFVFMANFDGTNNDRKNLPLSGSKYQTNVANLFDQGAANINEHFKARYYPGVGTGGIAGGKLNAGLFPTEPLREIAEQAYNQFALEARTYLRDHPNATYRDLSVVTTAFSRGNGSAMMFVRALDERGLKLPDGTVVAPPGAIPVTAQVLFDPSHAFIQGDLSLPPNVRGKVLVMAARDEHRADFRLADYGRDPRSNVVEIAGNHCGVGGGYELHGTSAAALEIATRYLQNSGFAVADVAQDQRFNPALSMNVYTENYQTARNGDVVLGNGDVAPGKVFVWRAQEGARQMTPVPTPQPAPNPPASPLLTHPDHSAHALFKQALAAVHEMDRSHRRPSDAASENLAAALTVAARREGLARIDVVAPSTDAAASRMFAAQDPGRWNRKLAEVPTLEAMATSIAQSSQAWPQAVAQQAQAAEQQAIQQAQQPSQEALSHERQRELQPSR